MNLALYIAKRYLFSKKSLNAINFVSGISVLGVFVGSAALIIGLSVFNGFEKLVLSMYNTFSPEIRIEPTVGKTFEPGKVAFFNALKSDKRITRYIEVLEEKALLKYQKAQYIGLVKGVSSNFTHGKGLDSTLLKGKFILKNTEENLAVIGSAVQAYLSIDVENDFQDLEIYSPRKGVSSSVNPAEEFVLRSIHPIGVYQIQQEFDEQVIVPIDFMRELLDEENQVSAIELNLHGQTPVRDFQKEIAKRAGKNFTVKNRVEQNQLLYKTLTSEKFFVYLFLTFVLVIAIFNMVGSLTMLVMDKLKDISLLSSMGASNRLIRQIFFLEGIMISMAGCLAGMLAGLVFCLLQQKYGFIKMQDANLTTDSYPIDIRWTNFILVFLTVATISMAASFISSRLSVKSVGSLRTDI